MNPSYYAFRIVTRRLLFTAPPNMATSLLLRCSWRWGRRIPTSRTAGRRRRWTWRGSTGGERVSDTGVVDASFPLFSQGGHGACVVGQPPRVGGPVHRLRRRHLQAHAAPPGEQERSQVSHARSSVPTTSCPYCTGMHEHSQADLKAPSRVSRSTSRSNILCLESLTQHFFVCICISRAETNF